MHEPKNKLRAHFEDNNGLYQILSSLLFTITVIITVRPLAIHPLNKILSVKYSVVHNR